MVENNSFENKYSIEEAYNEMVRRNLGDISRCPVCRSSIHSKTFAFAFCTGFNSESVNPDCKLAKYLPK